MHTAVFSIVSPNYLHHARVLMASAQRHHPEWDRFVLLVGGVADEVTADEAFTTVPLDALPLPGRRRFCFRYTILELNTAVKPSMFEELFARGYDRVVYLDPDTRIYSPLAELDAMPADTFMALTPHLTGSIGGDDHPSERAILQSGTYNLGFLAVWRQPSLDRFLTWWKEKLEFQCIVHIERGLFVDQKWMDLAPGLFAGVAILRHDGYNVGYWNLRQRTVIDEGERMAVNGEPLRFFHFSGVDATQPEMVSKHDGRLKIEDVGVVGGLIEAYHAALQEAGRETCERAAYAYGAFADGAPVPEIARVTYRNSVALQEACGDDPFTRPDLFRALRSTARGATAAKLGVKSYRLFSRPRALVQLLPKAMRTATRDFLLGQKDSAPSPKEWRRSLPFGLNVVGYQARATGVGESARLCRRACERVGLPSHAIDVDGAEELERQAVFRTSVYHVNADELPTLHYQNSNLFASSAYNIGCWHWELPELPDAAIASARPLDEIWAPSAFIQTAIGQTVKIPVVHMPHGVEVSEIEACSPQELGVPPGRFTFLCMFDLDSVTARKNPQGAIDAFRRAFPRAVSAALLIKVTGTGTSKNHTEQIALEESVRGVPGVFLTDQRLSRARVNGLLAACDGVVSLHRSEGFGLVLAEAMSLGKPVVATGWSGNMDFMTNANSCPVGYELVRLERAYGDYPIGAQWAAPDVDHAAHFMRRLVHEPAFRDPLGDRARQTIATQFSPEAAGLRYRRRLACLD
jgi:glycosyltransferase involved in cell wall biosynthesis